MNLRVDKSTLVITAGVVWIIAGANILKIGIATWMSDSLYWQWKVAGAIVVFALFFFLIFKRLYGKHTRRIAEKDERNHPLAFFDAKGWIIMAFMMTMGITIRMFHLLPDWFIALFYTGLSVALIATGFLFLQHWWRAYS
ncbi:hypothetical protein [uncultured Bacteroides sp.]|uniref:hypothetical protein n=1 Tax=uncultured Bacteroides sp. TaxID=162156 RepID=UPI002AA8BFE9|nr:hypothetical protein [uncultured Bacteroides sp.]